jgi:hypothetical protein
MLRARGKCSIIDGHFVAAQRHLSEQRRNASEATIALSSLAIHVSREKLNTMARPAQEERLMLLARTNRNRIES